ncbi:tetratricopeptide repeat protein [Anaeromyxobacter oryzae]|uniref:Tetratricopeptide repeat protein n=1 Tax=Anaeromyxobacter oryzae TaxID=2918170 RepID=A0ABN6MT60_9BACT|nr:tetratricopeptide repeat protein [Anaeromyxobacter oryzae]BDG03691.1 hypothetical protein AMOR_26870 [Anaeromyxobacter oryzae]
MRRTNAWTAALAVLLAGAPASRATGGDPASAAAPGAQAASAPAAGARGDRGRAPGAERGRTTHGTKPATAPVPPLRPRGAELEAARRIAAEGRNEDAERMLDALLTIEPARLDVLLERAQVRAHQGKYAEARADFNDVLVARPGDLTALTGLAYTLAWSGDLETAEWTFRRALEVEPGTLDAAKGLAYVALWRGQPGEAARQFDVLARTRPDSAELQVAFGQALYAEGHRAEARAAFEQALALEPGRADARAGLDATEVRTRVEATVLGGITTRADAPEEAGVRFAELAIEPADGLRVWAQYDDTLSLDNADLARRNEHVPAAYLGGLLGWGDRNVTRLEVGYRDLPGGIAQGLLRGEQVVGVGQRSAVRLGGWAGPREDGLVEAGAHAGVSLAAGSYVRIEPAAYWGRSGVAGENEVRGALSIVAESRSHAEIGGGVAAGRAFGGTVEGDLASGFFRAVLPVGGHVRAQLLLTHERPPAGSAVTVYALGLTVSAGGPR